jgi:hypothetical protein
LLLVKDFDGYFVVIWQTEELFHCFADIIKEYCRLCFSFDTFLFTRRAYQSGIRKADKIIESQTDKTSVIAAAGIAEIMLCRKKIISADRALPKWLTAPVTTVTFRKTLSGTISKIPEGQYLATALLTAKIAERDLSGGRYRDSCTANDRHKYSGSCQEHCPEVCCYNIFPHGDNVSLKVQYCKETARKNI